MAKAIVMILLALAAVSYGIIFLALMFIRPLAQLSNCVLREEGKIKPF